MTRTIRDDRSDLEIEVAELLAEVSGRAGRKPRWTELRLWRAQDGRYVVERVGVSRVIGEQNRRSAWTCEDENAVRKSLSSGPLSWRLLQQAGIV